MTIARAHLVDASVTRWYHCVLRCVRRADLLGEGKFDRKRWIERRLQELAQIFSVTVAAFAVLDDRLHVLVRLDPDVAKRWSNDDVVRRWARLSPPRDKYRQPTPVSDGWVKSQRRDSRGVATARERLQSLSWFMKCLKEPLSRLANREEQTRGAFFEGRFKSVAIIDEEALIVTCAYIDMLPVATGIAKTAEAGKHTSIRQRVKHVKAQGGARDLNAARRGSVSGSKATAGREEGLWLCPIEDRRRLDSSREGMVEGFSLGNYLLLLEYTGRLFREGEAAVSAELAGTLERLGSNAENWQARLEKLAGGRLLGRYFAASRARLKEVAEHLGVHHLANLGGCEVR
ncbi:MAG: transposase [Isosphaeraceae bacterium]